MDNDINVVQQAVGSGGLQFIVGYGGQPKWIVVANNTVVGNATGPTVQITVTPDTGIPLLCPYGEVRHYPVASLKWLSVSGNMTNISLVVSDRDVPMQVTVVTAASLSGSVTVNGNVGAQILGPLDGSGFVKVDVASPQTPAGSVKVFNEPS